MFVDPDDWVEEAYVEKLYNTIEKNDADLAICAALMIWDQGKKMLISKLSNGVYTVSNYYQRLGLSMPNIWVAIYKTNIIKEKI